LQEAPAERITALVGEGAAMTLDDAVAYARDRTRSWKFG
jgi:hypothetical protein